uniref:Uncharacterized protein n=1 Tax=Panagrolaimus superbus TaxID=310955 RepID=A0A914Z7V9_9BILA
MSKKNQAAKRTTKPLAWFLNEQLEKNSMETIMDQQQQEQRETPSPSVVDIRKCSVDSLASSINSTKIFENNNKEDGLTAGNKKRGKKAGRQRVKKVSVNFTIAGSENKEAIVKAASTAVEEKQLQQQHTSAPIAPASVPNAAMLMNNTKERKEDYWYYDPLSDGFYYENNGSRGWKKRNPKVHGPPPAAAPKKVPEIEKIIEQQKQKITNQKLLNQIGVAPSVKYYDPATDGYFFEMASVDGWRRRQVPPVHSSASSSTSAANTSSSVANFDRKPMNIPTSTIPSSSTMTSNNMNYHQHQNNQHHGYHPFGSFSSTTNTPTPSPAGSFMPQPAMTNAQLEEMIVRHPSLVASMSKNRFGGVFDEPCIPSNSSTTSSEELTSSPPPMISSVPEHSLLMQHFRRGQQLQQSNSASMLINGGGGGNTNITNNNNINSSSSCQTNNAFSVGSADADEAYEFFWSDNEKASSISSYDDMGDKEQSIPRESVIGGQRRPTTLSVIQDKTSSKKWWDTPLSDHRFDVDKFIADLPSFDDEKMLRNLTALPTPLSSDRHSIHQQQQHSNLITPLKENSWWFGADHRNNASNGGSSTNTNASKNLEKIDYDKIWRTPIIN